MITNGKGKIGKEMHIVMICDYMKWTYTEYYLQPVWFIDLLISKINQDAYVQNMEAKKNKR